MVSSFQALAFACCAVLVACYPNGAPREVCRMAGSTGRRPVHGDFMPQHTCPPFKLYLNVTDGMYRPGEAINVTLEANPGETFKGFLVTADSSSSYLFGTVNNLTEGVRGVANCGMTHTDNRTRTSISVYWVPATIPVGTVQFKAVVVQNFSTFYATILSPTIRPDKTKFPSDAQLRTMMAQAAAARQQAAQALGGMRANAMQGGVQGGAGDVGRQGQPPMSGPLGAGAAPSSAQSPGGSLGSALSGSRGNSPGNQPL